MYPKERGRTAGRAYISFVGTNTTINLFIPCNVIATCGMWEHRQKMRFTVSVWYRFRDGGTSSSFKGKSDTRLSLGTTRHYVLTYQSH
ncbi:Uncharacterised protein [Enterobacter hormaechei]|nr:hypothetical protein AI3013V2_0490 [Enterobacter cloacae]CAH5563512.1 hypothetical protein AI3013V2_0490 [Enterobacter cloacae]VAC57190.1 Uncharacterised protein [Enterobacter hormaechei]VAE78216.1 Uncharacterised protein [Enterobacter hormaechei]VAL12747.1 Uncharacterised protein [Enterobacter hormaechei]